MSCLKLIWIILSSQSLWVNWVKTYLIMKGSLWLVKENTQSGFWMRRKVLEYREVAKRFYGVEVKNGEKTSFWYERWSSLGCLQEVLREGGSIDLGISQSAVVADIWSHRRKHHLVPLLNRLEDEIDKYKENFVQEEDVSLWRNEKGKYKRRFSTRITWLCIRDSAPVCHWYKAVWFKHATPRHSFITWVAMKEGLSTGERMQNWNGNINAACVLCQEPVETLRHLFFECSYSEQIWNVLMRGVMEDQYTADWRRLLRLMIRDSSWSRVKFFTIKYMFQLAVHTIWCERNKRRHGEESCPAVVLIKRMDKTMRNKFTILQRKGDKVLEGGMRFWFSTREDF